MKTLGSFAVVGALLTACPVQAQQRDAAADYPSRNVRIIVSAPAGGGVDIAARLIADRLAQKFGHAFIVENRAGAGGNLGAEAVATAEPDGYTLLAAQPAPLTTNIVLYKTLNFDPTAFEPLAIMTTIPSTLTAKNDLPVNSVAELIAYAKANPGKLTFGSQGVGTTPHLTGELFARLTGTQLIHVPYRGTAQAVNDLIAGHVDLLFFQLDSVKEHVVAKKAKMLAVTTEQRVASMPDMPTMMEQGVAGFRADTWNALMAPPKTPAPILAKLNQAINDILAAAEMRAHFEKISMQPIGGKPDDIRKFIKEETVRWGEVIRAANLKAE
jgi:tripartite-type tricarboxylate transporter receptor subunit TctC